MKTVKCRYCGKEVKTKRVTAPGGRAYDRLGQHHNLPKRIICIGSGMAAVTLKDTK